MLLMKKLHKITHQDTRESRRKKHSNTKTAGKPTVRICSCLDSAGHLHKHHKQGFINQSSQKYLLDKPSDFKLSMSFWTPANDFCADSNSLADKLRNFIL